MTKAQAISRMNHADLMKKVDNYSKEEVKNYLHTIIMMNNVPGNKFLQKTSYEKNSIVIIKKVIGKNIIMEEESKPKVKENAQY